jgi:hypothetical protein
MSKPKNPAAVALGKLAASKPKHYNPEELARRTARIVDARRKSLAKLRRPTTPRPSSPAASPVAG